MKPIITFKCTNKTCANFNLITELQYSSFMESMNNNMREDYWTVKLKHCRKCHSIGEIMIQYGEKCFYDLDVFEENILGLAKEVKLLKKLVDRGVANEEEKQQFEERIQLLSEVKCPDCGKLLIDTVENKK